MLIVSFVLVNSHATDHFSVGGLGDSFYEYLWKAWQMTNGEDVQAKRMYEASMEGALEHLLRQSNGGLWYFGDRKYDHTEAKMDHLACFIGGLLALGARNHTLPEQREKHMQIAVNVTSTCHESYTRADTKLGPESFRFTREVEARAIQPRERYYMLRPEVVESYFYMWRLTKDQRYRDWAWEATMGLQNHCRTETGFSGIRNVYDLNSPKDDMQQSFLLAETFKYLYLIFSDDSHISLNEWVFNTEAHPLPVKGHNPAFPLK
jgi:mannosyl-oligosaccharide alpha-1,2-mannosidase